MATTRSPSTMAPTWVRQTRKYVLQCLHSTGCPPVERQGDRGQTGMDPAWVIRLIGVLAVQGKAPTYLGLHRLTCRCWRERCGRQVRFPPLSERP